MDWREKGLKTEWHSTREFDEHIKSIRSYMDDDLLRTDARCEMWLKERKDWRKHEETLKQIDEFNHCMSNFRYAVENIKKMRRRFNRSQNRPAAGPPRRRAPGVRVTVTRTDRQGPIGSRDGDQMSDWRKSLGEPIMRNY